MDDKEEMSNILGGIASDIQWVKDFIKDFPDKCDERYASKGRMERVEWFQKLVITGVAAWLVTNLLGLITKTQAAINIIF